MSTTAMIPPAGVMEFSYPGGNALVTSGTALIPNEFILEAMQGGWISAVAGAGMTPVSVYSGTVSVAFTSVSVPVGYTNTVQVGTMFLSDGSEVLGFYLAKS